MVVKLSSLESFEIKGRGTVYVVAAPWEVEPIRMPGEPHPPYLGSEVVLDGKVGRIVGVERDCGMRTLPVGTLIGILVRWAEEPV